MQKKNEITALRCADCARSDSRVTDLEPTSTVDQTSDLFTWRWPRLAGALLDSPEFYTK